MKDIGQSFKDARESIGLSKVEVSKDLGITESQLDNLEDGNANAFKDVFFLKDLIKKYTVYLNLNEDEIMDSFNNFIFSYTSKIPVDEILERTKELKLKEKLDEAQRVVSPYTAKKVKKDIKNIYIYILAMIFLIVLVIFIVNFLKDNRERNVISYNIIERGCML